MQGNDATTGQAGELSSVPEQRTVCVVGAGSWGTALAIHCARAGHRVRLYTRSLPHWLALSQERENQKYLPGISLGSQIEIHNSLPAAVANSDLTIVAVPSHGLRGVMASIQAEFGSDEKSANRPNMLLLAAKGVEVDSLETMASVAATEAPFCAERLAVLGGPSFAAEVAKASPTAVVVASQTPEIAARIQTILSNGQFRAYVSSDVMGVELGGACKNVIALAAGIGDGARLGHNARAGLITRGLAEMSRLAVAMGAQESTLSGLAGLGDLVLTCTGGLSRNRRVGVALGEGKPLDQILTEVGMVAEGVRNTRSVFQLAQRAKVEMPIVETMHEILYDGLTIPEAVGQIMRRALKGERA